MVQDMWHMLNTGTQCPSRECSSRPFHIGYSVQIVTTDILGSFPVLESVNSYILVATDYFTQWADAYSIPNQEACKVIKKLNW